MAGSCTITQITLVALLALQFVDLLQASDLKRYGELSENYDGFLKLCALEHLTRVEYKRTLGEHVAGLLLEDYFELIRRRQELGRKLLQFYCPVGYWSLIKDSAVNVANVKAIFDKKCAKEISSGVICSRLQQSREMAIGSGQSSASISDLEMWICNQYTRYQNDRLAFARIQKEETLLIYGATRPNLSTCSTSILLSAREEANKSVEEIKNYSIEQVSEFKNRVEETEDAELALSNLRTADVFEELYRSAQVIVNKMKSAVDGDGKGIWIKE